LVEFLPGAVAPAPAAAVASDVAVPAAAGATRLDVRGLEPPEPLVRILAACQALGPDGLLEVLHERRPELLYPRLDDLGLWHRTEEAAADLYRIYIRRKAQP
jgi:hypothetical protein